MQLMSVLVDIAAAQPEANVLVTESPDAPEVAAKTGSSPPKDSNQQAGCAASSPKSLKPERFGAL